MESGLTRTEFIRAGGAGLAALVAAGASAGCGGDGGCPAVADNGEPNWIKDAPWVNYPETQKIVPTATAVPRSLSDLAKAICDAEEAEHRVHAFGSKWAFSDCAITPDRMIDTRRLNRELQKVQAALLPGQNFDVYHVEAAITIRELYERLEMHGLALLTMGGASGQTLAGAVSTGTHGGDKDMPPLADSILALHLVGTGGTEYWIEPSQGITGREKLKRHVVPTIEPENVIYDDETFDACLVSLGCMGVIYAVVLRVRKPYDLAETNIPITWNDFKTKLRGYLGSRQQRFLQLVVSPYPNGKGENPCILTRRFEVPATGPKKRRPPDVTGVFAVLLGAMLASDPTAGAVLANAGVIDALRNPGLPTEDKLALFVRVTLEKLPRHRSLLVQFYPALLAAQFPDVAHRAAGYSVMDIGYGSEIPKSQPGHSFELHFDAAEKGGRRDFVDYIEAVLSEVAQATDTYFAGYISIRFTGKTRASLGMQQWPQTATVEVSTVRNVPNLDNGLLPRLYKLGFDAGALPHWGQELRLGGDGSRHPRYEEWRRVYGRMSHGFDMRTFENPLTARWGLTTPP